MTPAPGLGWPGGDPSPDGPLGWPEEAPVPAPPAPQDDPAADDLPMAAALRDDLAAVVSRETAARQEAHVGA
jgi:hypothetical protein